MSSITAADLADRIRSWARAHASTHRSSSDSPESPGTEKHNEAVSAAQNAQMTSPAGNPLPGPGPESVPAGSSSDSSQQTEGDKSKPDLLTRVKAGCVRFGKHTRTTLLHSWVNVLLVFVPVGIAAGGAGLNAEIIFAINAIAVIPLAALLSHATECVASRLGDTVGALINVTFGNAVELIIL